MRQRAQLIRCKLAKFLKLLLLMLMLLQGQMVSLKNVCQVSKADLPGWPLLPPAKMQLEKCKKCSREFCSTINYRRHARVHRRSLNTVKDFPGNRELLGAFWDKLSYDEAKEIVSLTNVSIEEVTGSSIVRALSSWIRKLGFSSLPQMYVKAGAMLLDVIQARPSNFPKPSQEFFSILDDASEKTFLCAGTTLSLQKFVFNGEVGNIALEMKNQVACISFFLEQQLVKAWLADKDAEALRCHKLLMEEEEAAKRKHLELLEKRRLKKLRKKAQKAKDLSDADKAISHGTDEDKSPSGTTDLRDTSDFDLHAPEESIKQEQLSQALTGSFDLDLEADYRLHLQGENAVQNIDQQDVQIEIDRQQQFVTQLPLSKRVKSGQNRFNLGQFRVAKSSFSIKHGYYNDKKAVPSVNGQKMWTRKSKPENGEDVSCDRVDKRKNDQLCNIYNAEVLIGSISVVLGHSNGHGMDPSSSINNPYQENLVEPDARQKNVIPSLGKLCVPVCHHGNENFAAVTEKKESRTDGFSSENTYQIPPDESCLASVGICKSDSGLCKDSLVSQAAGGLPLSFLFAGSVLEEFLVQRWKESITADHVKLVLSPETEGSDCIDKPEVSSQHKCAEARLLSYECFGNRILDNAEKKMSDVNSMQLAASASKPKIKSNPEKICKLKYVPRQRSNASGE